MVSEVRIISLQVVEAEQNTAGKVCEATQK